MASIGNIRYYSDDMKLDPETCYRAMLSRDAKYDGVFFTCVKTTGIYCRPICPARPPKFKNCLFLPSAAAAQEAGFRSCLRCRPECAPGVGAWLGTSATVTRAVKLIEEGALDQGRVDDLAMRLGVGERHLRRLFQRHLGASPIAVAQATRVLRAKRMISDTDRPITEIAHESGFRSIRRFNDVFRKLYGRSPSDMRKKQSKSRIPSIGSTPGSYEIGPVA